MRGEYGAGPRSTLSRKKRIRTGAVLLAVVAAQCLLIGWLNLTQSPIRTTPDAVETVPYYLTTARTPRAAPKDHAAARRPLKQRTPQAPRAAGGSPAPIVSPSAPAAPPAAATGSPAPEYGRWTVAPGARPEAGHGRIVMSVCAANLAELPAEARAACAEALKTAAADPPARRGAAPDWKIHGLLSSCSEPKNEPAHKLLLDHCRGLGLGLKVLF